jgi:hypothetical protein
LRQVADDLDIASRTDGLRSLHEVEEFLVDEILPHEANDETVVYPQMSQILPGEDPLATMSRAHREIFHLIDSFQRQLADLSADRLEPGDITDLRRTLYGLHAILRLHFDEEEELYASMEPG